MITKEKRKIISVEPISNMAKLRFDDEMSGLHSCYVEKEDLTNFFLCSINKKYKFVFKKQNDSHWKLIK